MLLRKVYVLEVLSVNQLLCYPQVELLSQEKQLRYLVVKRTKSVEDRNSLTVKPPRDSFPNIEAMIIKHKFLYKNIADSSVLLEEVSRPVYLHFFDRQLLTSLGAYEFLPLSVIYEDLLWVLMSTYEPTYIAVGIIFENKFIRSLLKPMLPLFQLGHIQLAMKDNSLQDFILDKRSQYSHAAKSYSFYWDDTWKKINALGLFYQHRQMEIGKCLEKTILQDLSAYGVVDSAKRLNLEINQKEITEITAHTIESIAERNRLAITPLLFEKKYQKLEVYSSVKKCFNIKISEHYVNAYIAEYNGTLATGLRSGIEYFSYLCPTFPFHHLPLWRQLNHRIGCLPLVRKLTAKDIVLLRESTVFQKFIDEVRFFIARITNFYLEEMSSTCSNTINFTAYLERKLRVYLRNISGTSNGVDEYLRVVEQATARLSSTDLNENTERYQPIIAQQEKTMKDYTIFVVHGRNQKARKALFELLRAAGLRPLEWNQVLHLTGQGTPYIGEVIDKGLEAAQAIVVLFTGDDLACLREELLQPDEEIEQYTPQPRPNVILEAGIALGKNPNRTVIVQIGKIRPISDLAGRHFLQLDNSPEKRKALLMRLKAAGCVVDLSGDDWMSAGQFSGY